MDFSILKKTLILFMESWSFRSLRRGSGLGKRSCQTMLGACTRPEILRDTAWRRERVMLRTWIEGIPLRYRSKKLSEASQHTSELADIIYLLIDIESLIIYYIFFIFTYSYNHIFPSFNEIMDEDILLPITGRRKVSPLQGRALRVRVLPSWSIKPSGKAM